jgi:hypothetical protein
MATKRVDPDDPMELVGVALEEDPDDAALTEMAWSFVEEYARMGWDREQILRLFRSPSFHLPHRIWQAKGEEFILELAGTVEELRNQVKQRMDGSR